MRLKLNEIFRECRLA